MEISRSFQLDDAGAEERQSETAEGVSHFAVKWATVALWSREIRDRPNKAQGDMGPSRPKANAGGASAAFF